jgi:hypothetical protein
MLLKVHVVLSQAYSSFLILRASVQKSDLGMIPSVLELFRLTPPMLQYELIESWERSFTDAAVQDCIQCCIAMCVQIGESQMALTLKIGVDSDRGFIVNSESLRPLTFKVTWEIRCWCPRYTSPILHVNWRFAQFSNWGCNTFINTDDVSSW